MLDFDHQSVDNCTACPMPRVGTVSYPVLHRFHGNTGQYCLGYLHCELGPIDELHHTANFVILECDDCGWMQRVNNVVIDTSPSARESVLALREGKREVFTGMLC